MTRKTKILSGAFFLSALLFIGATFVSLEEPPDSLRGLLEGDHKSQFLDRNGVPLSVTYQNRWNVHNYVPLTEIPKFVKDVFILSEDQRFYSHHGIDWIARFNALLQNVIALDGVRGASTITEQVVKMTNPRPRTLWTKWIEGLEAVKLEQKVSKDEIFEFYLNQAPYASNRRGVAEAARGYFDRDIKTLSQKEAILLAILVRAPSRYDLWKRPERSKKLTNNLADRLLQKNIIDQPARERIVAGKIDLAKPKPPVNASYFINYLKQNPGYASSLTKKTRITIDARLQDDVIRLLNGRMASLKKRKVNNAGVVVANAVTGEILSWVTYDGGASLKVPGEKIDAVTTLRQPGSLLKPFLYAHAIEKGWNGATIITDGPLEGAVGNGFHGYLNYSNTFYGPVMLRDALANSLNTPAVRAVIHVDEKDYLNKLHDLGFASLDKETDHYGSGLALGNGEVSLLETVRAFTSLASKGKLKSLKMLADQQDHEQKQIYSFETTSIIGDILSDPHARRLEFGSGGLLQFPVQTAIKTGTSTDYRDAWIAGYNYKYVVGVWMGNMDQSPMDGVTGSIGPALLLKSIFARLNEQDGETTKPLYISPNLRRERICQKGREVYRYDNACMARSELFANEYDLSTITARKKPDEKPSIVFPTPEVIMAVDPRIPKNKQIATFKVNRLPDKKRVEWRLNKKKIGISENSQYEWLIEKGEFTLTAFALGVDNKPSRIGKVNFLVR